VLALPKIKFFIDHNNKRIDKTGRVLDDDEYGQRIKIDPQPNVRRVVANNNQAKQQVK
jgi:hypothetical protein